MDAKDKRALREEKRAIKNRGNKRRRQQLKRQLQQNPEEAHVDEFHFGRHASARLNGIDRKDFPEE